MRAQKKCPVPALVAVLLQEEQQQEEEGWVMEEEAGRGVHCLSL